MNVRSEICASPNVSHKTFERWLFKSIEDGCELIAGNLFEEDLYRRRGVACRFEDRCREEHLSDPLADRLRRVGDMIAFYRTRPVRDDDIDAIRDAMEVKQHIADYADDPQYGNVVILLEAAVEILRTRHVVIDDDGTVWGKEMETFRLGTSGGGRYHDEETITPYYGSFCVGFDDEDAEVEVCADRIVDLNCGTPADVCEDHLDDDILDDDILPKSVANISREVEKSKTLYRQLHLKTRFGSVEMSLEKWLQTLDLDEDAYCCYAESGNAGKSTPVAPVVIDMYLADVASWNGGDANELAEAVGNGYSVSQVLSGECDIPANAGSLIVGFGEYEKTLAEWFDDSSYAEEERERARDAVFGCGRFSIEPVERLIRQHAEQMRLAELERVERARLEELERKNPIIKYDGKSLRASEWAGIFGLPQGAITARFRNNWNVEDVLHVPYPCGSVLKVDGRIYTEEMIKGRFGMTLDAMRSKLKAEEAARQKIVRKRREEARREENWNCLAAHPLVMAGITLSVSQWMECLNVSRDDFGRGDVRNILSSSRCDAIVRGVLRCSSKYVTNESVLMAVEKWRKGTE